MKGNRNYKLLHVQYSVSIFEDLFTSVLFSLSIKLEKTCIAPRIIRSMNLLSDGYRYHLLWDCVFVVSQYQRMLTGVTLIGCVLSLCFTDHYEGEVLFSTERNLTIDHQELVQVKKRYRFSLFFSVFSWNTKRTNLSIYFMTIAETT